MLVIASGHGGQVPDQHRDGSATSDSEKSEDENFPTEHSVRGQEDLEGLYLAVQQCNADLKKIGGMSKINFPINTVTFFFV